MTIHNNNRQSSSIVSRDKILQPFLTIWCNLSLGENIIKVAVKTIKEADRFDMKDFMLEMEMMKEIGCHPNVVSLLGVSSIGAPLYIITEYAEGGNLLDLLRSSRCGSSK